MKQGFTVAAVALATFATFAGANARAGDLQFTVERKKVDAVGAKPTELGGAANRSETWHYQVKVQNDGFKPTAALQAKYIVFVERQELGKKIGTETIEKVNGTATLQPMATGATAQFTTSDITLKESSLIGNSFYLNGGRIHAKDSIRGVWIKLFDGTKEVDQYVNPSTIATKEKWQ